jgi:hypothetical protein
MRPTRPALAVGGAAILAMAGLAQPAWAGGPPGLTASAASRAFDIAEPALARVRVAATATYQVAIAEIRDDQVQAFLDSESRHLDDEAIGLPSPRVNALYRDWAKALRATPGQFFAPGNQVQTTDESSTTVGSGAVVSSDGIVVTSPTAAPDDAALAAQLGTQARSDLQGMVAEANDGATGDLVSLLTSDAPSGLSLDAGVLRDFAQAAVDAQQSVTMASLKATAPLNVTRTVQLGRAGPGQPGTSGGLPATPLITTAAPAQIGVTVLRVPARHLATVALAPGGSLRKGMPAVVAGFDATNLDGGDVPFGTTVLPDDVDGRIDRGSDGSYSFSVGFDAGRVGGPVLDGDGNLIGVADTLDSRLADASAVSQALRRARVHPSANPLSPAWAQAMDDFTLQYYKDAQPLLEHIRGADRAYPYVDDFLARAARAIRAGQDRTPSLPVPAAVIGVLLELGACVLVAGRLRPFTVPGRRRAASVDPPAVGPPLAALSATGAPPGSG